MNQISGTLPIRLESDSDSTMPVFRLALCSGDPFVLRPIGGAGDTWSFRQGATEESVSILGPVHISVAEGVRAAVLADIGLAVISAWMFSLDLASGAVQRVLPDWSLPPIDLWAVYPTGRMSGTKARAFAAFVEAELTRGYSPSE
jgi:DNA-binding transcriptional LysR family regulator